MLDCITHPLKFPPYSKVARFEGLGNWAIDKYYKWPLRYFYRHKIRMIERMLRGKHYENIMDFGGGPGLFESQWKEFGKHVYNINEHISYPSNKMDLIICASVMEFVDLRETFSKLASCLERNGDIVVASPMAGELSALYFDHIRDINERHSHQTIISEMSKHFNIRQYRTWLGLYFCAIGKKR